MSNRPTVRDSDGREREINRDGTLADPKDESVVENLIGTLVDAAFNPLTQLLK